MHFNIFISDLSFLIHSFTFIFSIYSYFDLFILTYLFTFIYYFLCLLLLNLLIIHLFHSHYLLVYYIFYFLISNLLDKFNFPFFNLLLICSFHFY